MTRRMQSSQQGQRHASFVLLVLLLVSSLMSGDAWTPNQPSKSMLGNNNQKSTQKPNLTERGMIPNPGNLRVRETSTTAAAATLMAGNGRKPTKLSQSVLASCDTLPEFPTAHGLLSPETVVRLEDLTARGLGNEALVNFLDQYRRKGPLSCLSMLSDPEILPHLTQAMREIA